MLHSDGVVVLISYLLYSRSSCLLVYVLHSGGVVVLISYLLYSRSSCLMMFYRVVAWSCCVFTCCTAVGAVCCCCVFTFYKAGRAVSWQFSTWWWRDLAACLPALQLVELFVVAMFSSSVQPVRLYYMEMVWSCCVFTFCTVGGAICC